MIELLRAKQVDHFILSKGFGEVAAFYRKYGPRVIDSHSRWVLESALNIYTGKDMLKIDFPLSKFFLIVFMIKFNTLF